MDLRVYKAEIEELQIGIKVAEKMLKEKQDRLDFVLNTEIANLMTENGIETIEIEGMKFSYRNELYASIRSDFKQEAIKWLRENSSSDKIKEQLLIETDQAEVLIKELKSHNYIDSISYDAKIHWKTLQSLIKSLLSEGITVPEEYFSTFYKPSVKIS